MRGNSRVPELQLLKEEISRLQEALEDEITTKERQFHSLSQVIDNLKLQNVKLKEQNIEQEEKIDTLSKIEKLAPLSGILNQPAIRENLDISLLLQEIVKDYLENL